MADDKALGGAIAGSLIATSMLRVLIERGLLTPSDVAAIFDRAMGAVSQSVTNEEVAASRILTDLRRQLFSGD